MDGEIRCSIFGMYYSDYFRKGWAINTWFILKIFKNIFEVKCIALSIMTAGDSDVGDLKLLTICEFWWLNFDVGDTFWMLMPDATNVKR